VDVQVRRRVVVDRVARARRGDGHRHRSGECASRDRDDFTAIQCKFYDADSKVEKKAIDSFLSLSMRPDYNFSQRIVFDTSAGWTGNAEETMKGVAQRVDVGYLDDAKIDWSAYSWTTPEVVVPTGPKTLRPHQTRALEDVRRGLSDGDRGKLVMACGTGKTFTSLKIAEDLVGAGGSVLFLVPSIQLMSQSLREWMAESSVDIRPFAVCSDVRVGRKASHEGDLSTIDLTEPATTKADKLLARMSTGKRATERMTVVFSTYQSIDVIARAQQLGLAGFDLIICDEAHRTTGVTLAGQDESHFVKVHDGDYLKADRRLYMTATPRVFGDEVRRKATDAEAVLADMGDESYSLIQQQLRDLGGLLGTGGLAAAEAATAVSRLKAIKPDTIVEPRILGGFHMLFGRIDHRIADIAEEGIERGAFAQRVTLPRLATGTGQLIQPVRERYRPLTCADELPLLHTLREQLRPQTQPQVTGPGTTRAELHAALIHRPSSRASVTGPHL
jgi:hypothetical protein